jgi:hypothetical protein
VHACVVVRASRMLALRVPAVHALAVHACVMRACASHARVACTCCACPCCACPRCAPSCGVWCACAALIYTVWSSPTLHPRRPRRLTMPFTLSPFSVTYACSCHALFLPLCPISCLCCSSFLSHSLLVLFLHACVVRVACTCCVCACCACLRCARLSFPCSRYVRLLWCPCCAGPCCALSCWSCGVLVQCSATSCGARRRHRPHIHCRPGRPDTLSVTYDYSCLSICICLQCCTEGPSMHPNVHVYACALPWIWKCLSIKHGWPTPLLGSKVLGRFDLRRKYFLTPGFPSGIPYMSDITTT